MNTKTVRNLVTDYRAWLLLVNDADSILEALDLEARYRITFWDALIVQAAQAAGAELLYSEDLADGQHYSHVLVKNPLPL